jgi:hypothetical protein
MKSLQRSWNQGLYEVSDTLKEAIGALRILEDGRKFRYARTGSSLALGIAIEGSAISHADLEGMTTPDIAQYARDFVATPGGNITEEENHFKGGYHLADEGTVVGYTMKIRGSGAEVDSTVLPIKLEDGLPVARTTGGGDKGIILTNDYSYVIIATTITNPVLGVTIIAAKQAVQYMWVQTGGIACCSIEGAVVVGTYLIASTDNGQLSVGAFAATSPHAAYVPIVDTVDEKYYPIKLIID